MRRHADTGLLQIINYFSVVPLNSPSADGHYQPPPSNNYIQMEKPVTCNLFQSFQVSHPLPQRASCSLGARPDQGHPSRTRPHRASGYSGPRVSLCSSRRGSSHITLNRLPWCCFNFVCNGFLSFWRRERCASMGFYIVTRSI